MGLKSINQFHLKKQNVFCPLTSHLLCFPDLSTRLSINLSSCELPASASRKGDARVVAGIRMDFGTLAFRLIQCLKRSSKLERKGHFKYTQNFFIFLQITLDSNSLHFSFILTSQYCSISIPLALYNSCLNPILVYYFILFYYYFWCFGILNGG